MTKRAISLAGLQLDGVRATRARYPNLPGGIEVSPGYDAMIGSGAAAWTPPQLDKYGDVTFYTDEVRVCDESHIPPSRECSLLLGGFTGGGVSIGGEHARCRPAVSTHARMRRTQTVPDSIVWDLALAPQWRGDDATRAPTDFPPPTLRTPALPTPPASPTVWCALQPTSCSADAAAVGSHAGSDADGSFFSSRGTQKTTRRTAGSCTT